MIGQILFGKYQIEEKIASGGMGVVYKVIQPSLDRSVAIKVLHPHFSDNPIFIERFQREAKAIAHLNHENIVHIYEIGEYSGSHFIVMEYFPGKNIKQIMMSSPEKRQIFSITEILHMGLCVASALMHAHTNGVIHRDITSGNILMDTDGRIKVIDFGIAAIAGKLRLTVPGKIIGNPEYISPEQAEDKAVDGRTDLYSLGMVLYEMITGRTHYHEMSGIAILADLASGKKEHSLSFPPDSPPPIQNVYDMIRSLLKRNPKNRIADATSLISRIKQLAADIESTRDFTTQPIHRSNIAIGISVLIFIGVIYHFASIPILPDVQGTKEEDAVAKPPVAEPKTPVVETKPPVVGTKPPVVGTKPPVVGTKPPVVEPIPEGKEHYLNVVNEKLEELKMAYQNHDVEMLLRITAPSEGRSLFLRQLFENYTTIHISISDPSFTNDNQSASAVLTITHLVDTSGNQVTPAPKWKDARLLIVREGTQWGKIAW